MVRALVACKEGIPFMVHVDLCNTLLRSLDLSAIEESIMIMMSMDALSVAIDKIQAQHETASSTSSAKCAQKSTITSSTLTPNAENRKRTSATSVPRSFIQYMSRGMGFPTM